MINVIIRQLRESALDLADLVIDFATLGEYGLEAPTPSPCEPRLRSGVRLSAVDRGEHLPPHLDRTEQHVRI